MIGVGSGRSSRKILYGLGDFSTERDLFRVSGTRGTPQTIHVPLFLFTKSKLLNGTLSVWLSSTFRECIRVLWDRGAS